MRLLVVAALLVLVGNCNWLYQISSCSRIPLMPRVTITIIYPHEQDQSLATMFQWNRTKIDLRQTLEIRRQIGRQMCRKIEICQTNQNYNSRTRKAPSSREKNWSKHQLLGQKPKVFSKIHLKIVTLWWYQVSQHREWAFGAKNWKDQWLRKHRVRTNWPVQHQITTRIHKSSMKLWSPLLSVAFKKNCGLNSRPTPRPAPPPNNRTCNSPPQPLVAKSLTLPTTTHLSTCSSRSSRSNHKAGAKTMHTILLLQTICQKTTNMKTPMLLKDNKIRTSKRAVRSLHRIFSRVRCQTNLDSNQAIKITQLRGCPKQAGLRAPSKHCTWVVLHRLLRPLPNPILTVMPKLPPILCSSKIIVKASWLSNSALERLSNLSKPRGCSLLAQLPGNY